MNQSTGLARQALRGALEVRRKAKQSKDVPICVYDLAAKLGVEVKFCPGNSFEGLYSKTSGVILVPSLRPPGRQSFTAAHELGHWHFGHGSRVDELPEFLPDTHNDREEWLANLFAAYLLMPSWAIEEAFKRRNWTPANATPSELYVIAAEFGVGYDTLLQHLHWSLQVISPSRTLELGKVTPKAIREQILGSLETKHLVIVDRHWLTGNIDLQVGHVALVPADAVIEGRQISFITNVTGGQVIQATKPGIGRIYLPGTEWAKFLRVSRADFEGRSIYRHLEDADAD